MLKIRPGASYEELAIELPLALEKVHKTAKQRRDVKVLTRSAAGVLTVTAIVVVITQSVNDDEK